MTTVEVPAELAAALEDALARSCLVCGHPVRAHLSTSGCPCCARGVRMPSKQAAELTALVRAAVEERRR